MAAMQLANSSVLSDCFHYRYRLSRGHQLHGPTFLFIGVNPSTADERVDDATIRKMRGFVARWAGRGFWVGNAFAYRTPDVAHLASVDDPVGPHNALHLAAMVKASDVIVPCWGARQKLPRKLWPTLDAVQANLAATRKPLRCLGFTSSGDPRHPLFVSYDTPLVELDWSLSF